MEIKFASHNVLEEWVRSAGSDLYRSLFLGLWLGSGTISNLEIPNSLSLTPRM